MAVDATSGAMMVDEESTADADGLRAQLERVSPHVVQEAKAIY